MDFADFVKRMYRDEHDSVGRSALQRLGRALERSGSLETLLNNDDSSIETLSSSRLANLADAHRDYLEWKQAAKLLRRSLTGSGLTLPDGSLNIANTPHEIRALERTASLCQRSGHADHDGWATAVRSHVELWRATVELSLVEGSAAINVIDPSHPDALEFENCVSKKVMLHEIKGYRWFAIRRGERAGILSVALNLPLDSIREQTQARLPLLGLVAQKRGVESLMKDLVLGDLEPTLRGVLDKRAEREALGSARSAYLSLLKTPPLQADKILAAYEGNPQGPMGLAVLDKKGDVVDHIEVSPDTDAVEVMSEITDKHKPEAVVLPITIRDKSKLKKVEQAIALPVQRVHDAAVSEARKNLPFEPMVSSAVVLGRRALRPGREWCRIDPLSLGLGEYPRDLDHQKLSQVLREAKLISSWERRQKNSSGRGGQASRRAASLPSAKRLNPFVKTIRDLKPEMIVDGVITNLTRFGAFVNIGLPTEGMIHVSQLSDDFIEDPSQLVSVGQQVKARVLEVVPEKERIALSLKPAADRRLQEAGPLSVNTSNSKPKRETPKTRSAALADLDALFKK
jgi:predicted RNA-binding protein with RPS1 domain